VLVETLEAGVNNIEDLLRWNFTHAGETAHPEMDARPRKHLLVLTCMDARLEVERTLGTSVGDIHLLRNAGGVVTSDVIRSVVLSQRELETDEIMIIQHTRCGLLGLDEPALRSKLETTTGIVPDFEFLSFTDLTESVRRSLAALDASPFVDGVVRGFIFDIDSGVVDEVFR
jgi:carbonic anhydrase